MSRSKWKGPHIEKDSLDKIQQSKKNCVKLIVSRNTTILPKFVEKTCEVYNGNKFNEVFITEEMIGHKFGEFSATRKRFLFKKNKQKNNLNGAKNKSKHF